MSETVEAMWARALDAAASALEASRRAGTLPAKTAAPLQAHLQEQRSWLQRRVAAAD